MVDQLFDLWRGLWGRGSNEVSGSAHLDSLENWLHPASEISGCVICARRTEASRRWLDALEPGADASTTSRHGLIYCPRHCRLLLANPDGRQRLLAALPAVLRTTQTNLQIDSSTRAQHQRAHPACPPCQVEHEAETNAIHAAAAAPTADTGRVPGLTRLVLCHDHTILVAARIVGRLGPEPRAIPDLHALLAGQHRHLRHLTDRDPRLPATQVLAQADDDAPRRAAYRSSPVCSEVADAVLPTAGPETGTSSQDSDPDGRACGDHDDMGCPRPCAVCTAAVTATRTLLLELAERVVHSDRDGQLTLCAPHLYDLIALAQVGTLSAVDAALQAVTRAHLLRLGPVLDRLDSRFARPHKVRTAIVELARPLPCPACLTYREAQRHAVVAVPRTASTSPEALCYRHAAALPAEHDARARLTERLRQAEYDIGRSLESPTQRTTPHPLCMAALAQLDGRIPTDIAGADEDDRAR